MDFIPMVVFEKPQRYWPVIDNAIRRAVTERGCEVKVLAAALHDVPKTLKFLQSLKSLDGITTKGSIDVKIFKVPATDRHPVLLRDRRTHNKFVVTEQTMLIGTSNWSGDYFQGSTGVALVITQNRTRDRPLMDRMKSIMLRDWHSEYAHDVGLITRVCLGGDGKGEEKGQRAREWTDEMWKLCEVKKPKHVEM